jgi:hypothetical protein
LHTVSFRKVGAYLGRDVRLGQLPIVGEVEQLSADVVMLIPLKDVSEEIAKGELHALLKQEPLALMVAGPMAEVLFDAMLRLLNDGQDRPHTMTWISRCSDIPSAIEEFLYAVLPADTRWDDWTGYVVFAGAEWTDTVRTAVSTR